jgi:hypothetical protein
VVEIDVMSAMRVASDVSDIESEVCSSRDGVCVGSFGSDVAACCVV